MTGNWELPTVGTPGTIRNSDTAGDNGYLNINGNIEAGSAVEEVANDGGQKWERSANDDSGYFTLKNPNSGLFLIGHNPPKQRKQKQAKSKWANPPNTLTIGNINR